MAQTSVAAGSNLALTQNSVVLTAQIIRAPGNLNSLTGPAPKQKDAEKALKLQSDPGMPFVRITDLSTDPVVTRSLSMRSTWSAVRRSWATATPKAWARSSVRLRSAC